MQICLVFLIFILQVEVKITKVVTVINRGGMCFSKLYNSLLKSTIHSIWRLTGTFYVRLFQSRDQNSSHVA